MKAEGILEKISWYIKIIERIFFYLGTLFASTTQPEQKYRVKLPDSFVSNLYHLCQILGLIGKLKKNGEQLKYFVVKLLNPKDLSTGSNWVEKSNECSFTFEKNALLDLVTSFFNIFFQP